MTDSNKPPAGTPEPVFGPLELKHLNEAALRGAEYGAQAMADKMRTELRHRDRRLMLRVFFVSVLAVCAICLPVILSTESSNRAFERANAIYDCNLFAQTAHWMGLFVDSDARLRTTQNHQALGKKISVDLEKIIPRSDLVHLAKTQGLQTDAVVHEWDLYARKLSNLGSVDCVKHLGG